MRSRCSFSANFSHDLQNTEKAARLHCRYNHEVSTILRELRASRTNLTYSSSKLLIRSTSPHRCKKTVNSRGKCPCSRTMTHHVACPSGAGSGQEAGVGLQVSLALACHLLPRPILSPIPSRLPHQCPVSPGFRSPPLSSCSPQLLPDSGLGSCPLREKWRHIVRHHSCTKPALLHEETN